MRMQVIALVAQQIACSATQPTVFPATSATSFLDSTHAPFVLPTVLSARILECVRAAMWGIIGVVTCAQAALR